MASTTLYENGDKSDEYVNNNNASIFISGFEKNKIIVFKPYLKSFSFSRKMKESKDSEKAFYSLTNKVLGDFEMNYSLSFDVVSVNLQEAKDNHSKFQFLMRFLVPPVGTGRSQKFAGRLHVKFSNLIHQNKPDSYREMHRDNGRDGDITQIGLYCQIDSLDYNPDLAMGFFEDDGLIFAKSFSIDLKLTPVLNSKTRFQKKREVQRNTGEVDNGQLFGFNPRTRGRTFISQIEAGKMTKAERDKKKKDKDKKKKEEEVTKENENKENSRSDGSPPPPKSPPPKGKTPKSTVPSTNQEFETENVSGLDALLDGLLEE